MDLDDIPGLREARAWEASKRIEAFLDVPRIVCGVEVLPLTLHRLAVLTAAQSPFFCGGIPAAADVAIFLWVVSPGHDPRDADARTLFLAGLQAGAILDDVVRCVREIGEYLDEMFLDAPAAGGRGKSSAAVTSSEAVFVDLFADAYGWNKAQTLHEPLPQIYQLLRRITTRRNPEARFINRRSDKVRGDWNRAHQHATEQAAAVDTVAGE